MEEMTRDDKISFIIEAIWHVEGVAVVPSYFKDYTDDELAEEADWLDYLLDK